MSDTYSYLVSYRLSVSVTGISLVPGDLNEDLGPVSRKADARNVVDVMTLTCVDIHESA